MIKKKNLKKSITNKDICDPILENGNNSGAENSGNIESDESVSFEGNGDVDNEPGKYVLKRPTDDDEDNPPKRKKQKLSNNLYKPPTVEELNKLRETENLFNSNIFRLQIEETLKEIKIKNKFLTKIRNWFNTFQNDVAELSKNSKQYELSDEKLFKKLKINIPFLKEFCDDKTFFKFIKPNSIEIIGLFNIECLLNTHINVDINIEIPRDCFHKSDSINGRYIYKRYLYFLYIYKKLKFNENIEQIKFCAYNGNILQPTLEITPKWVSKNVTFTVHTSVESNTFKCSKFNPSKSNIRADWYCQNDNDNVIPTPIYNSVILEDLTRLENEKVRTETLQNLNNVKDGLKLLQVWFKQRELDTGYGSFTRELLSMFVVYLIKNRKLSNAMSSYQIIRNVWINLVQSHWDEEGKGISLCKEVNESHARISDFHKCYKIVFVDVTGYYNLASHLNLQIYLKIKKESEMAIRFLDNANMNSFQALFMTKMPFYRQFDHIIQINNPEALKSALKKIPTDKQISYLFFKWPIIQTEISNILSKGLRNRITSITPKLELLQKWSPDENPNLELGTMTFGINLDQETAYTILEKGPPANTEEAKEFRSFWGEKSELRRFQDGSITEAVVWSEGKTLLEKRSILKMIVEYLLKMKFGITFDEDCQYINNQCDFLLTMDNVKSEYEYGSGEEIMMKMVESFDELSKQLRMIENLPLAINTIQGCASSLRYTDVFPSLPTSYRAGKAGVEIGNTIALNETKSAVNLIPRYTPSIKGIIQLSLSGKWPNNLEAVQHLKAAFYLKIAETLTSVHKLVCVSYPKYINVFKDGWVFQLYLSHQKEIALLKKSISNEGVTFYRDTPESLKLEREVIHLPKITSALHGIYNQYPSFGGLSRIAKRWLRSQLLDEYHVPSIVLELIAASLYTSPEPYERPVGIQCAFFRLLYKLMSTDWQTEALIVNFNNEISKQQLTEVETLMAQNRQSLPPLFVVTPYDLSSSIWTKSSPSRQVLLRIAVLAKESLEFIESKLYAQHFAYKSLFKPSLSGYDVIIYLNPAVNPVKHQAMDSFISFENWSYKKRSSEKMPVVDFNPVQLYLEELRNHYDEFALFFHDTYGGSVIGVLWKPTALEKCDFKVSSINGRRLLRENGNTKLVLNTNAILEDFYVLGKDIVRTIDIQKIK